MQESKKLMCLIPKPRMYLKEFPGYLESRVRVVCYQNVTNVCDAFSSYLIVVGIFLCTSVSTSSQ